MLSLLLNHNLLHHNKIKEAFSSVQDYGHVLLDQPRYIQKTLNKKFKNQIKWQFSYYNIKLILIVRYYIYQPTGTKQRYTRLPVLYWWAMSTVAVMLVTGQNWKFTSLVQTMWAARVYFNSAHTFSTSNYYILKPSKQFQALPVSIFN